MRQFVSLPGIDTRQPLAHLLAARRTVREFVAAPIELGVLAALLWAAQGITRDDGLRTAPSAGALYPLELYAVTGEQVRDLPAGVYRYQPKEHALQPLISGDQRTALAEAALGQEWLAEAAAVLVVTAFYRRTARKYRERAVQYAHLEAGHAAQNVCLMAVALGLGTATVGAFNDVGVQKLLVLTDEEQPLYLLAVGTAAKT
jgi:SagB-type dehydrogenase family enzyme